MWNRKSFLLKIKVKVSDKKPKVRFCMYLALYVPYQFLLAFEGIIGLIPGKYGAKARLVMNTLQTILLTLMTEKAQSYVDVNVQDKKHGNVKVDIKTIGFQGEAA